MITYIPQCDGIYLGTIVQEGHTTFAIYPHFSYIFNPVPWLKGVWIQEGSLWIGFMPQEPLSGGSSWHLSLSGGSRLSSLMPSSPSHLTVSFLWKSLQVGNCRWNVPGCYSGSSSSHLLGCLSQPLPNEPWAPQLPPQFCQDHHSLDLHHSWCPLLLNVPSA